MKYIKLVLFLIGMFAACTSKSQTTIVGWKSTDPRDQIPQVEIKPFEVFIEVTATTYQATRKQCDSNPCISASGYNVCSNDFKSKGYHVVAVSQDFIKEKRLQYFQVIKLKSLKKTIKAVVVDCMNSRFRNKIDILSSDLGLQGKYFVIPTSLILVP